MMRIFLKCLIIGTLVVPLYAQWEDTCFHHIKKFLNHYKRPITVFESCYKNAYSLSLASQYPGVFVIHQEKKIQSMVKKVQKAALENVIVVHPHKWDTDLITQFARSEYMDVTIIRYLPDGISSLDIFLKALCEIGDYIFLELDRQKINKAYKNLFESIIVIAQDHDKILYLLKTYKKGLDVARWNLCFKMPHQPVSTPRYFVRSTFTEKNLYKEEKALPWLAGLNLMSFIMLEAVYPFNEIIKEQFPLLKNIEHNDLVLGNFIITGKKIVPIDFKDTRRKIDKNKCIQAAIAYFSNKARFKNAPESLNNYQALLNSL